jgi:molybdopterin converting factor small subunit
LSRGEIHVKVTIEGYPRKRIFDVPLSEGSRLRDLLEALVSVYGDEVHPHLYDTATGKLGFYMVILGREVVMLPQGLEQPLKDDDEVFIISPVGGG